MQGEKRSDLKVLRWSVIGFTLVILIPASLHAISTYEAFGLFFSSVLVTVTIWYAANTKRMAEYAKAQAEENAKMAKEMREQRIMDSRPYILIRSASKESPAGGSPCFSHFEISNVGNGPAIEMEVAIADIDNKLNSHQIRRTFLRSQDEPTTFHPADLAFLKARTVEDLSKTTYYCVCEYRGVLSNIGEKTWYQTWLPFEILIPFKEGKKAGEMVVTPGELQFKEVREKDRINAFKGGKPL